MEFKEAPSKEVMQFARSVIWTKACKREESREREREREREVDRGRSKITGFP